MTTSDFRLDPVFKKFPTIFREAEKIGVALAAEERGARLTSGFLPYAVACQNLISKSAPLRKVHQDLDDALAILSIRVQVAYNKIAPSEFLAAIKADDVKTVERILKISDLQNKWLANGEMPLHYAIRMGSSEVVRYLLSSREVNPFARDHQSCPPRPQ